MRFARTYVLTFLSLLSAFSAFSQQTTTTVQRDPQAVVILTQSLSLMVPSPATISDAVLQGNYSDTNGLTGTIVLKCRGNSHLRHEISLNGSQQTLLVRQGVGRAVKDGNSQNLPFWATKYLRPDYIPAFSRLSDFILPNTQIVYVGLETLPDRSLHHIRLSSIPTDNTPPAVEDKMSEYHLFIDSHSGLLFKTLSFGFSPEIVENRIDIETYYDAYQAVGGLLIPSHITRFIWGQRFDEITLTSIQINVGLSDAEFN